MAYEKKHGEGSAFIKTDKETKEIRLTSNGKYMASANIEGFGWFNIFFTEGSFLKKGADGINYLCLPIKRTDTGNTYPIFNIVKNSYQAGSNSGSWDDLP